MLVQILIILIMKELLCEVKYVEGLNKVFMSYIKIIII